MSEWSYSDKLTAALLNQKTFYVGSGAPSTTYDGQPWVDISTDPPVLKFYDDTNSQWMEYRPVYYETQVGAWADPSTSNVGNGTLVVVYNSDQSGTRLYAYSNNAWVNLGGTLTRVYPETDNTDEALDNNAQHNSDVFGYDSLSFSALETKTLDTITITPSEDDSVIVGFAAIVGQRTGGANFTAKLYINNVLVDSSNISSNGSFNGLKGTQDGLTGSIDVELKVSETDDDVGDLQYCGYYLAAYSVKT